MSVWSIVNFSISTTTLIDWVRLLAANVIKFRDSMIFILLIFFWIFRWYLNRYYSMILIWCYYLVSVDLSKWILSWKTLFYKFLRFCLGQMPEIHVNVGLQINGFFCSTRQLRIKRFNKSIKWIWINDVMDFYS